MFRLAVAFAAEGRGGADRNLCLIFIPNLKMIGRATDRIAITRVPIN
jgi:hypothetical protein